MFLFSLTQKMQIKFKVYKEHAKLNTNATRTNNHFYTVFHKSYLNLLLVYNFLPYHLTAHP